jgi:hypothetical protein
VLRHVQGSPGHERRAVRGHRIAAPLRAPLWTTARGDARGIVGQSEESACAARQRADQRLDRVRPWSNRESAKAAPERARSSSSRTRSWTGALSSSSAQVAHLIDSHLDEGRPQDWWDHAAPAASSSHDRHRRSGRRPLGADPRRRSTLPRADDARHSPPRRDRSDRAALPHITGERAEVEIPADGSRRPRRRDRAERDRTRQHATHHGKSLQGHELTRHCTPRRSTDRRAPRGGQQHSLRHGGTCGRQNHCHPHRAAPRTAQ